MADRNGFQVSFTATGYFQGLDTKFLGKGRPALRLATIQFKTLEIQFIVRNLDVIRTLEQLSKNTAITISGTFQYYFDRYGRIKQSFILWLINLTPSSVELKIEFLGKLQEKIQGTNVFVIDISKLDFPAFFTVNLQNVKSKHKLGDCVCGHGTLKKDNLRIPEKNIKQEILFIMADEGTEIWPECNRKKFLEEKKKQQEWDFETPDIEGADDFVKGWIGN